MFDLLNFQPHSLPNAVQALYKFDNDWQISVVSGSDGKLYGNLDDGTYEVAIFRPNGNMIGDISGWNTKQQVSAMMTALSLLSQGNTAEEILSILDDIYHQEYSRILDDIIESIEEDELV